jgi:hypothetical protein
MRHPKTMRDEFALVFLAGLTQNELMSQQVQAAQGSIAIKTKPVEELVQVAYNAADAAMKVRAAAMERMGSMDLW